MTFLSRWISTVDGREVIAESPPPTRRFEFPVVTIERSRRGSVSATSFCVTCPREGAASPTCCAYPQFLALAEAQRKAQYDLIKQPARSSGRAFKFWKRRSDA